MESSLLTNSITNTVHRIMVYDMYASAVHATDWSFPRAAAAAAAVCGRGAALFLSVLL